MTLVPLHDPAQGPMRVAGFLSRSGTNIRKILEHQRELEVREGRSPYELVVLFTDRADSQAVQIGKDHDLPVVVRDLSGFCTRRRVSRRDLRAREAFDLETVSALSPFNVQVAAYGGYMSIATRPLMEAFIGVNVHPADLSIESADGRRRYVGDQVVRDAIAAGQRTIASSTHIVEREVDQGRLLMVSAPVEIFLELQWDLRRPEDLQMATEVNQERLKEHGDWIIFPRTLEDMGRGKFAHDEQGRLYHEGRAIPKGWRL